MYIIAKILAIIAVIAGYTISYKHWDGELLIVLFFNGMLLSLLFMIPVGIILILLGGIFNILGYVLMAGAIGALAYFIYEKVK